MTPPCYTFSASDLDGRVQLDVHGRQRKPPLESSGDRSKKTSAASTTSTASTSTSTSTSTKPYNIDLAHDCALLASMAQYSCVVAHPRDPKSPVRCWPVQRMFRRCQDRSGSFTVETTAWETAAQANGQATEQSSQP